MLIIGDIFIYLLLLLVGMIVGYWVIKCVLDGICFNVVVGCELVVVMLVVVGIDVKVVDL